MINRPKPTKHELKKIDNGWKCTICGWTWKRDPGVYGCPSVPRYEWEAAPEHLLTTKQLRKERLKPGGPARGCVRIRDGWCFLYDRGEAVPVRAMSEKQAAALAKARERAGLVRCPGCKRDVDREYFDRRKGLCWSCLDQVMEENERMRDEDARDEAITWARAMLASDCVILDTETTDLDRPEIIEVAVINLDGSVLLNERVLPASEITPGAQQVHGISREMLDGCPAWPDIYPRLAAILAGHVVVSYNATFDSRAVAYTSTLYHMEHLDARWECAMEAYALFAGEWSNYFGSYKWQPLMGGDHSAAGDCRATLALIQRMAAAELSSEMNKLLVTIARQAPLRLSPVEAILSLPRSGKG